jgi:CBS-domain-containing membrane protein
VGAILFHVACQLVFQVSLANLAADLMCTDPVPLRPEDRLDRALKLLVESDLLPLPVVDEQNSLSGMVKRLDVSSAYLRHV